MDVFFHVLNTCTCKERYTLNSLLVPSDVKYTGLAKAGCFCLPGVVLGQLIGRETAGVWWSRLSHLPVEGEQLVLFLVGPFEASPC